MEPRKGRWDTFLRSLILAWLCLSSSGVIARNIERYDTAYECEGKTLKIECREGELIHLIRANYGRFSITICNEHGNTDWSVNCMSPKSFRVLYNKCNQQQNCSIVASTSMFGDPCPNTLKYLEAHYQCVPAATTTTSTRPSPPSWILTSQPSVWSTVSPPASRSPSRLSTPSPGSAGSTPAPSSASSSPASAQSSTSAALPSASSSSAPRPTSTRTWTEDESVDEEEEEDGENEELGNGEAVEEEDDDEEEEDEEPEEAERSKPNRPAGPGASAKPPSQQQQHHHHHQHQQEHEATQPSTPPPQQPRAPFTSTIAPWKTGRRTPPAGANGEPACPSQRARNLAWNATRLGESAVQSCPGGANGLARWQCVSAGPGRPGEAGWQRGTPNLSECRSVWLSSLEKRVQEGEVILRASSELSQVTNNSRELYGGDMLITTKILSKMAERMAQEVSTYQDLRQREVNLAELLQGAVTTGSNLLDKAQAASWKDLSHLEQMQVATSLLIGLEENAFLLADTLSYEKNIVHERRNILMEVRVLDARNLKDRSVVFPEENGQRDRWARLEDQVELSQEALLDNQGDRGLVRLVFMAFDRLEEILQPEAYESSLSLNEERKPELEERPPDKLNVTRIINSKIISASLGKGRHTQFKDPSLRVRLYFRHLVLENVTKPKCVFWDYTTSGWSEDGCVTKGSNETHTICECNHLTNFAILMEIQPVALEGVHAVALQIITYVGCIVSIVCLVLAIITFQLFRGLKSDRTTIHKNLCVCLLIAEVLFICGIDQTSPRIVCGIVAGLLHFFFLCAFAWMFLEGFQLYVMLIEVFEAEKSRLRWYYLFAYGLPLLVVAVSSVINPQGYGTDDYCWLKAEDYFIFSFVGPVILVILANLVFLSMAVYMMCRHSNTSVSMKSKEHSRLASAKAWLKGAIVLVFLLGLTWTFGLLYLNEETVAMAYIFTVFNSLQGLFIFLFHCVQNEKVRKEYRKFIRRHSWLPKCLRCSKDGGSGSGTGSGSGGPGTSGGHPGGHGGKDYGSHNTSSNPSGPTTDSSGLSPHNAANSNNISSKPHPRELEHEVVAAGAGGPGHHNAMTLQGYSLRARERRLIAELEVGSRATTGRRAHSPYNHFYTEIREQQLQQQQQQAHLHHHYHHHHPHHQHLQQQQQQDDPVYEEIERATGQASDLSDEDGRRQSDMSRQSSRSYGDHRPLIPYSPGAERGGLEAAWAIERLRRQQQQQQQQQFQHHHQQLQQHQHPQQQQQQQQQQQLAEQQLRPQDHTRTVAVLDGHTVVCHLQPQAELYAARGLAPPSYSEC